MSGLVTVAKLVTAVETDEKINFGHTSKRCCSVEEIEACLL